MLRCGIASKTITPDYPIALGGFAARWGKKSIGVHDPIYTKAFYASNNNTKLLMLFADVLELKESVLQPVKERIKNELAIDKVSFSATHTHSAPHTSPQPQLPVEEMDAAWVTFFQNQMFEAAKEALENTFSAKIGYGSILVPEIARNRRAGHTITDPTMSVLRVDDLDGNIRWILVSYACHCTVLDGNSFLVSSDYPGYLYKYVQKVYPNSICAFANGCCGDINIGYSADASALGEAMDIRTFENAERIGNLLGERAVACANGLQMQEDVFVALKEQQISLPLRTNIPSETSIREEINRFDEQMNLCSDPDTKKELLLGKIYQQCILEGLHGIDPSQTELQVRVQFIRFGKRLYVTAPGELFTEPGLAIKELLSNTYDTVVLGYSNGHAGYIPSKTAMLEGGYECETSIFAANVADTLLSQLALSYSADL